MPDIKEQLDWREAPENESDSSSSCSSNSDLEQCSPFEDGGENKDENRFTKDLGADNNTYTDSARKISIDDRVKDFLSVQQPRRPPESLRISKKHLMILNTQNKRELDKKVTRTQTVPVIKNKKPAKNGELYFTSGVYLDPFVRNGEKKWYYSGREGACRYLRVPPTPELTVDEIFQKDDKTSQEPI